MNNRLQKKCFIVSAGLHLLLVVLLVVGPAFLAPSGKSVDVPLLNFIPLKTIDGLESGGGSLTGGPPPPPAPAPAPLTPAPAVSTPPPPSPRVTAAVPEPKPAPTPAAPSLEVSRKPKLPEVSTKLITRQSDPQADARKKAAAQAQEQTRLDTERRQRLAGVLGSAASRLGSQMSGTTQIQLLGPGGGGIPYANFLQAVKTVYEEAWIVPDGVTDDSATTGAAVTIARDGSVVSTKITHSSGNAEVDHSVQRTLERVRFAAPLPDDATENQRTVDINFNVKAKRGLG